MYFLLWEMMDAGVIDFWAAYLILVCYSSCVCFLSGDVYES